MEQHIQKIKASYAWERTLTWFGLIKKLYPLLWQATVICKSGCLNKYRKLKAGHLFCRGTEMRKQLLLVSAWNTLVQWVVMNNSHISKFWLQWKWQRVILNKGPWSMKSKWMKKYVVNKSVALFLKRHDYSVSLAGLKRMSLPPPYGY